MVRAGIEILGLFITYIIDDDIIYFTFGFAHSEDFMPVGTMAIFAP